MSDSGKKSFEEYYEANYQKALGYVRKKIGNSEDAEDLVMECFYTCFQKFDDFDPEKASFATWLYVVINNRIKNYYRDSKTADDIDDTIVASESFENDLLEACELSRLRSEIYDALQTLNETQRQIIILKYFQDKNASEISEMTGQSPGNIRIQLMRGMNKIRDYFNAHGIEWEGP